MKPELQNNRARYHGERPSGGISERWENGTGVLSPADSRHPRYAGLPGGQPDAGRPGHRPPAPLIRPAQPAKSSTIAA